MKTFLLGIFLLVTSSSFASTTQIDFIRLRKSCTLRVVTELPVNKHVADVLFLTGFSDRADNHKPLFELLANNGYRVISFDYPSHGETKCLNLDLHNFTSISNLAEELLAHSSYRSEKPLYLSGWSTGGLLSYRMLQRKYFKKRIIAGAILLAPGLSVHLIPGENGMVTIDSLLSNPIPPHRGPIKPKSPLFFLGFSTSLVTNGMLAKKQAIPEVPILMVLGDDLLDVYADSSDIKSWYSGIKRPSFMAYQCTGAKHEVDNEIEPIGNTVRQLFLNFVKNQKRPQFPTGPCNRI